jgi:2-oxoisovalerate dehydrogenase E1 component
MRETSQPYILECMTLRLEGHAVYDKALYVTADEREQWMKREPLVLARAALAEHAGYTEQQILAIEATVATEIEDAVRKALAVARPDPTIVLGSVYAPVQPQSILPSFSSADVKNIKAVTLAQEYILNNNAKAFIMGMDIGPYGSAFASCKGLHETFGSDRVLDMPIAESAITGFALGASQTGGLPIIEYQFADFSTEAATQLGLNCATWYFRSGCPAQILFRLPCGGGITLGAFHSGEFDGIWSRFTGLKVLYPYTPQETFEALVAGFYDPNPCIVLEHKLFYASIGGAIEFNGSLENILRPRKYTNGNDITIIAFGAAITTASTAINERNYSAELWNPFIINPGVMEPIYESVRKTGRLLVVQESNDVTGMGNHYASLVARNCFSSLLCAPQVISAPGIPVPFAPELETWYRPDKEQIISCIDTMTGVTK